jgi:hypothetical protein
MIFNINDLATSRLTSTPRPICSAKRTVSAECCRIAGSASMGDENEKSASERAAVPADRGTGGRTVRPAEQIAHEKQVRRLTPPVHQEARNTRWPRKSVKRENAILMEFEWWSPHPSGGFDLEKDCFLTLSPPSRTFSLTHANMPRSRPRSLLTDSACNLRREPDLCSKHRLHLRGVGQVQLRTRCEVWDDATCNARIHGARRDPEQSGELLLTDEGWCRSRVVHAQSRSVNFANDSSAAGGC